ncbi:MAG: nucleotidyltransferase domain-containing protein [Niameybacter sp.]|uniref:nucleotidyltransferase domain-containing protein n=1 Tax=Niameybacter sp. TaxID=2033640 RepID=UPI002FC717ED
MNLRQEIEEAIVALARQYIEIEKVVLFGSRARGDNTERSDIDLAIWSEKSMSEFAYALEEEVPTLLEFDLSYMNEVEDAFFREQVTKEGIVLYEKPRF